MPQELFAETLQQFGELARTVGAARTWVQLTGGEPLLHPQVWEFLAACSAQFVTRLLTNGTLLTAETARQLRAHCASVQISFDGLPNTHDSWRGAGAYQAAWKGLQHLRAAGVRSSARVTVGKENQEGVEALLEELAPYVQAFHFSRVVPLGGCDVDLPDTDAYRRLVYRLCGRSAEDPLIQFRDPFCGPLLRARDPRTPFSGCSAGLGGICVTETGDIYPCRRLPVKLSNVAQDRLVEVSRSHPLLQALRARALQGACGSCADKWVCGGSRCVAYAMTGDPLAADPGCIFV
jgi:radical SAM protein with 4Fe4S-binding SPASM domain